METPPLHIGLLVLNREKSRLFEYHPKRLIEFEDFCHNKLHLPNGQEIVEDGPQQKPHRDIEPQEQKNLKQHEFEVFLRGITIRLQNLLCKEKFNNLIVVAPSELKNTIHLNFEKSLSVPIEFPMDANLVSDSWQNIFNHVNTKNLQ